MTRSISRRVAVALALLAAPFAVHAGGAPESMHYQGVLRDTAGNPIDGSRDMVFRFFDAAAGGNEILTDTHSAANGNAVVVSGGLFGVSLGGGVVADGTGPGSFTLLSSLFGAHTEVYLQIQVAGETLNPRVQVHSAAFALNAASLGGLTEGQFLRSDIAGRARGPVTVTTPPANDCPLPDCGAAVRGGALAYGGHFEDCDKTGRALLGGANLGITASGINGGGYFSSPLTSPTADARLANLGTGIVARGDIAGGHIYRSDFTSDVKLAYENIGVEATAETWGGFFKNTGGPSKVRLASATTGVHVQDVTVGAMFFSNGGAMAEIASDAIGIYASGATWGVAGVGGYGGYFEDSTRDTAAYVASGSYGVAGFGDVAGIRGEDTNSGVVSRLAYGAATVAGNGTKEFVQNHPYDATRAIHYSAVEGDEVATYTRGTARLVDGVARVQLGETFQWVTNPDLGLTAHLTPRQPGDLWVESLSTTELVVGASESSAQGSFDYIVYGLRIGFEDVPVLRERHEDDARIPSMAEHREQLERRPELRSHTAAERYVGMRRASGEKTPIDFTASDALRRAIGEFDPIRDRRELSPEDAIPFEVETLRRAPAATGDSTTPRGSADAAPVEAAATRRVPGGRTVSQDPVPASSSSVPDDASRSTECDTTRRTHEHVEGGDALTSRISVVGPVAPGDVIAVAQDGSLRRAEDAGDAGLVGIIVETVRSDADGRTADGEVVVALAGIVVCNADAGYGEIRPGDLLTTSPTPGRAMRAAEAPPGTILGKALEGLAVGTGSIRVLVMQR